MVMRALVLAIGLLVATKAKAADDTNCLALTAFTEAGSQGEYAMALVAHTVVNRAKSSGKSICQVAYQPNQYFGPLNWPKSKDPARVAPRMWSEAVRMATKVLANNVKFGACMGATHFYAPALVHAPRWTHNLAFKCEYGGHKFYAAR